MSESRLIEKEVSILRSLEQLSAERARAETLTEQEFLVRKDAEARAAQHALQKLKIAYETESETLRTRYQEVRAGILKQRQTEHQASAAEHAGVRQRIAARYNAGKKSARRGQEDARWQALAVYEAAKDDLIKRFKLTELEIKAANERLQALKDESEPYLDDCRPYAGPSPEPLPPPALAAAPLPEAATAPDPAAPDAAPAPDASGGPTAAAPGEVAAAAVMVPLEDPLPLFLERNKQIEEQLVPLAKLGLPRFLKPQNFLAPLLVLGLAGYYPLATVIGWVPSGIVCGVLTIAVGVAIRIWLGKVAKRQVGRLYHPFCRTVAEAELLREQSQVWAKATVENGKLEVQARREQAVRGAEEKFARTMAEIEERRTQDTRAADDKYPALQREIDARRDEALRQADDRYPHRLAELEQRFERESKQLGQNYAAQKDATVRVRDDAWNDLAERWRSGLAAVQATADAIHEEEDRCYFDWTRCDLDHWQYPTPTFVPPA